VKQLDIELTDLGGATRHVQIPYEHSDMVKQIGDRIQETAEVDGIAVIELALGVDAVDESRPFSDFNVTQRLGVQRVCVEVHFETESEKHWFPVLAKWATVHRWACKEFEVARDACANLELREGSPTGQPINERQPIGESRECKVVWVVKPGPEPNGR
jgi:hypothetical protein